MDVYSVSRDRLQPKWLEYDWVGDNVYFALWLNFIGVCSRVELACAFIMDDRVAPQVRGGEKFALDPPTG